ncbi:MAG: hypothetical protein KJ077_41860 [Anaerolineae bacterium]|nr:hypothetical protein [Anaerolineae bacterium]
MMSQSQEADPPRLLMTQLMDDLEPAMLDFVKTNVNSFTKWDLLRFFYNNRHMTNTAENIAKYAGRTVSMIERELDEWVDNGIVVKSGQNGASAYSLMSDETTWALMSEFVSGCEDRHFRIKVVHHIIQADPASL